MPRVLPQDVRLKCSECNWMGSDRYTVAYTHVKREHGIDALEVSPGPILRLVDGQWIPAQANSGERKKIDGNKVVMKRRRLQEQLQLQSSQGQSRHSSLSGELLYQSCSPSSDLSALPTVQHSDGAADQAGITLPSFQELTYRVKTLELPRKVWSDESNPDLAIMYHGDLVNPGTLKPVASRFLDDCRDSDLNPILNGDHLDDQYHNSNFDTA